MRNPSFSRISRLALTLLLTACFSLAGGLALAETEEETMAKRLEWQDRYRVLLQNQAILKDNVAKLRHAYAQAQRRNYPRGGARERFLTQADEQQKQLDQVERELETIFAEARQAEIPPGWLYEVDDEELDLSGAPAAADLDDGAEADDEDLEGRNPLYRELK